MINFDQELVKEGYDVEEWLSEPISKIWLPFKKYETTSVGVC